MKTHVPLLSICRNWGVCDREGRREAMAGSHECSASARARMPLVLHLTTTEYSLCHDWSPGFQLLRDVEGMLAVDNDSKQLLMVQDSDGQPLLLVWLSLLIMLQHNSASSVPDPKPDKASTPLALSSAGTHFAARAALQKSSSHSRCDCAGYEII